MFNLIPNTKYTKEELEKIEADKIARIVASEETEYEKSFGHKPTKEERDNWFRNSNEISGY